MDSIPRDADADMLNKLRNTKQVKYIGSFYRKVKTNRKRRGVI
jgi:hypothetical protein